jgi:hypothetical protein
MRGFDKCEDNRLWLYFTRDENSGKRQGSAQNLSMNPYSYSRPNLSTFYFITEVQVYMEGTPRNSFSTRTLNVPKTSEH